MPRRRKTPTVAELLSKTPSGHAAKHKPEESQHLKNQQFEKDEQSKTAQKEIWPALNTKQNLKTPNKPNDNTLSYSAVLSNKTPYHKRSNNSSTPTQSPAPWPPLPYRSISITSNLSSTGLSTATEATALSLSLDGHSPSSHTSLLAKIPKPTTSRCRGSGKKQASTCSASSTVQFLPSAIKTMLTDKATVMGTIGILPPELREIVWQNLSFGAAIQLAATNKHYRSIINPDTDVSKKEKLRFLRSQEDKSKFDSPKLGKCWFACTGCMRLKPEKHFSKDQVDLWKFRKGGGGWRSRRCLDCQIKEGVHKFSARILNAVGKTMRFCKPCGGFRSGNFCVDCSLCETCLGGSFLRCSRCHGAVTVPPETHVQGGRFI